MNSKINVQMEPVQFEEYLLFKEFQKMKMEPIQMAIPLEQPVIEIPRTSKAKKPKVSRKKKRNKEKWRKATPSEKKNNDCSGNGFSDRACNKTIQYKFGDGYCYCTTHWKQWVKYYEDGGE